METTPKIPQSNGLEDYTEITYKSRKFILSVVCLVLLTVLSVGAIFYPGLVGILPVFVSGIVGILSLYFTGNIANKYVMNKTLPVENSSSLITSLPSGAQSTAPKTEVPKTEVKEEDATAEA